MTGCMKVSASAIGSKESIVPIAKLSMAQAGIAGTSISLCW